MKPRALRNANLITVLAKNPVERREDNEESFSFRCGRKTPENFSRENPHIQAGTENSIHIVPPVGFELESQEVEGKARCHYTNLTAQEKLFNSNCDNHNPQSIPTVSDMFFSDEPCVQSWQF